jgi:dipeptidyl aminopeptidase/acylaminoacyl peptidase
VNRKWIKIVVPIISLVLCLGIVYIILPKDNNFKIISPIKDRPLDKYTIENLRVRGAKPSPITIIGNKFYYYSDNRKISGVITGATESATTKPAILMLHGSADEGEYYPGFGTDHVAKVLAKNGFITFAPDFLGYGESDSPTADDFENRFLTYTTNMDLMASINCVGIWGHSNGGQIALSILAITGTDIPTVLWNPVTKPFPYNILYFTDGYEDEGRWLRKATADFEKDYDVDKYSFDKYLDNIKAPILLQQGEADEWVPVKWNRQLNSKFQTLNSKIKFLEYSGADHNMTPKWNEAVNDLLRFFKE